LRVAELPDFIALDALRRDVDHRLVEELCRGAAHVHDELQHGVERRVRHAGSSADRVPFDQGGDELGAAVSRELVHAPCMPERSGMVKLLLYGALPRWGRGSGYFPQRALAALRASCFR